MPISMTNNPKADHELYVMEGLIERLSWAFNAGGLELVRAQVSSLGSAFADDGREPASWVLDAWLAKQVQRAG